MRLGTVVLLAAVAASAAASFSFPEATSVRLKRQQCRCLRLVNGGGMQCSCMQPLATNELGAAQGGLASQVSQAAGTPHASCQCIQIFISDSPTYRCLCDPRPPIQTPGTTVGVTIQTTIGGVTQPTQPTLPPATLPTLPPITTAPTTLPPLITVPVTQQPTYPTNPPTFSTAPPTLPPITTPPTVTPPFTVSTAPTTYQTPPTVTSPPLITPSSTFPPITNPPVTVTLPPITYPVTVPTVTTASPLPTPGPSSTTPGYEPVTQTVPPSQGCQCIMIRINGPQNAQYQCSCPGVVNPIPVVPGGTGTGVTGAPAIPNQNDAPGSTNPYPATGVTNGTSAGCFCLDGTNPNLGCGCSCDCLTLTVSIPTGVCVCPQDDSGRVVTTPRLPGQTTPAYTSPVVTPSPVQPGVAQPQTLPPITAGQTYPTTFQTPSPAVTVPIVYPTGGQTGIPTQPLQPVQPTQPAVLQPITTTFAPIVHPGQPGVTPAADGSATTTLPLTTTCVLYPVTSGATQQQCTCMAQYEQCAQNVCCLSTRFRSQKKDLVRAAADATGVQESTLDIFVDMFNKIKDRFSATA